VKVALVHYWLVSMRGGERVLEVLCDLFPDADIFTLVIDRERISQKILRHRIKTSFLQKIGGRRHYRKMLPLMPFALEQFDLTKYDLVISSESGPAKAVVTAPDSLHICYCHSPMRYVWDLYPDYYAGSSTLTRMMMALTSPALRIWDAATAARVDHFIANSQFVAARIRKYYRRDATVINPPVDISRFQLGQGPGEFYLCAGQIVPNKRVDLAVDAFSRLGLPLIVVGGGADPALKRRAASNVKFVETATDEDMAQYFSRCKALVFPGVEDFGIVPLEVLSSGRPVIAFARGGALETVIPGKTGILFYQQTVDSLLGAIAEMEQTGGQLSSQTMREFAAGFDRAAFASKMSAFISEAIASCPRMQLNLR
jgi:glycosyltransferase involved in cell wall biosynthesis